MEFKSDTDLNKLIGITEDFINFIVKLYNEGTISYEQYQSMTIIKKEFLENTKFQN